MSWSRSTIWPMRRPMPGCSSATACTAFFRARSRRRQRHHHRRQAHPRHRRARPREPAARRQRRRDRAGMHRLLHRPRGRREASRCGRQERADLGAGEGCRPDRRLRRQRRQADGRAQDRLERVLHDQLPRAGRQGAERRDRHRARPDDDDPRLHQRPEDPRPDPPRPSPGPCRGHVDDPDDHGRCPRRRRGPSGAEGQARRLGRSRAGARWKPDRPDLHAETRHDGRRSEQCPQGREPRAIA